MSIWRLKCHELSMTYTAKEQNGTAIPTERLYLPKVRLAPYCCEEQMLFYVSIQHLSLFCDRIIRLAYGMVFHRTVLSVAMPMPWELNFGD